MPDRAARLARLREMALVLAADVVDYQLGECLDRQGMDRTFGAQERILVCLTPRANAAAMLATARMMAQRFHAELIAAYVSQPGLSAADNVALEEKLGAARAAGASVVTLNGEDPVNAILDFAASRGVTQLFIGHSQRSGLRARIRGNPVDKLIRLARGMDVRVFPH
jgi:two-component system, OmpR family, sensor histidine kinase KdpD